jgi:hypothetical protein
MPDIGVRQRNVICHRSSCAVCIAFDNIHTLENWECVADQDTHASTVPLRSARKQRVASAKSTHQISWTKTKSNKRKNRVVDSRGARLEKYLTVAARWRQRFRRARP